MSVKINKSCQLFCSRKMYMLSGEFQVIKVLTSSVLTSIMLHEHSHPVSHKIECLKRKSVAFVWIASAKQGVATSVITSVLSLCSMAQKLRYQFFQSNKTCWLMYFSAILEAVVVNTCWHWCFRCTVVVFTMCDVTNGTSAAS